MNKLNLDDDGIICMYCKEGISLKDIGIFYNVSKTTIRRHLIWRNVQIRQNGVRIGVEPWSLEEDELLIKAREAGTTGKELSEVVTTRTRAAIKARMHILRSQKKLR